MPRDVTFGSVCSGIEAASVAWHPLGWRAAWVAEIEPSPALTLHDHYGSGRPHHMLSPDEEGIDADTSDARRAAGKALAWLPLVALKGGSAPPNLGDMTKIAAMVRAGLVAAPDVLVGGTPCQAFSIAGLRDSMDDARGQLTLSFARLADAIDSARHVLGLPPAVVVWENVPGVLSTADNAFGCLLGALAGEDCPVTAPGGKWTNAGCVLGPQRAVAWRVLDAQYFGVAQRRKRVFVVASAREGFDPAAVLFEFDGVRRDSPPSREAGQDAAAATIRSTGGGSDVDHACGGHLQPVAFGGNNQSGPIEIATACRAHSGAHYDFESETFMVQASVDVCPTLRAGGNRTGGDRPPGTDVDTADSLIVRSVALRGREGGATAELGDDLAGTLRAGGGGGGDKAHVLAPIAFDSRQDCVSSTEVFGALGSSSPQAQAVSYAIQAGALRQNPNSGPDGVGVQAHIAYTLEARAEVQAVAFSCKDHGADASVDIAPTMRAMGHSGSHANAGGQLAVCITGDVTHCLKAEGVDASEDGTGRGQPIVNAFQERGRADGREIDISPDMAYALLAPAGGSRSQERNIQVGMAVRRLTPRECERLQSFPDDYTLIPVRKISAKRGHALRDTGESRLGSDGQWWQLAADGPRYKALGNSMCVYNMRWIGRRIDAALAACAAVPEAACA